MPYGQFTGYQSIDTPEAQAAGGGYLFSTADGQQIPLHGPSAADLASRVDASNAAQANQSIAPATPPAAPAAASAPVGHVKDRDAQMYPELFPEQAASANANDQAKAQAAAAANAPPAVHPQVLAGTKSGGVMYQNAQGDELVKEPGHAGSKGGLQLKSEEKKGGYDPSQAYLEETARNDATLQQSRDIGFAAASKQAAMDQAAAQANQAAQANAEAEAKNRQWQIDQQVAEKNTKYENALSDYQNSKVDPGRLTRGNWGLNIARLLGTIASSLPTRPGQNPIQNYAGEMVDRQIDQDIDAQKAEIAVKKDSANNALTDLTRKLGSQQLAVEALRGIRQQQAATAMQQGAAQTADANLSAGYLAASAEAAQKAADHKENYLRLANGEITQHIVNAPSVSASGPHTRAATLEELKAVAELKHINASTGAIEAKTADGPGGIKPAQQAAAAKIDSALAGLNEFDASHASEGRPGIWTTGVGGNHKHVETVNTLAPLVADALGGGRSAPIIMKQFREDATSASGEKIQATIAATRQRLLDKRAQILNNPAAAETPEPAAEEPPTE